MLPGNHPCTEEAADLVFESDFGLRFQTSQNGLGGVGRGGISTSSVKKLPHKDFGGTYTCLKRKFH